MNYNYSQFQPSTKHEEAFSIHTFLKIETRRKTTDLDSPTNILIFFIDKNTPPDELEKPQGYGQWIWGMGATTISTAYSYAPSIPVVRNVGSSIYGWWTKNPKQDQTAAPESDHKSESTHH